MAGTVDAADTGAPQNLTSVSQFSDVASGQPSFEAVQSLVERYGVANGFKTGTGVAFRPNAPLSRADMIMLVDAALDRVAQLAEMTVAEMPPEARQARTKGLSIMQGAKCKSQGVQISHIGQVKDLPQSAIWYDSARNLAEKWSVRIVAADMNFDASAAVSTQDARECLKLFSSSGPKQVPAKLTRGDFAVMLNDVLDDFTDELAQLN